MLNVEQVLVRAAGDFEFSREMRYYSGDFHVTVGDEGWRASFADGHLESVESAGTDPEGAAVWIRGTVEQWEEMTAPKPRPFFQSLQSSAIRHGVQLSNTSEFYAYLPAMNRFMQIFRILNAEGA